MTEAGIADAVWDEMMAGHSLSGSMAKYLSTIAIDVAGINGAPMRGTDNAALASKVINKDATPVYSCYPELASILTLTAGISWVYGSYVEIVPVNTITTEYWLIGVSLFPLAGNRQYVTEVASGLASSEISRVKLPTYYASSNYVPDTIVMLPIPIKLAANTRISARVASNVASETLGIKILYATGL